ncbi:ARL14 effector protein-like [Rhopilema esculentum]|uniref:ARL14 effector protein-like n=1 Tax=Rhopilema esculentum TaxID=499914 RepID=UPI0031D5876B|eukprot:gene5846-11165_t
MEMKDEPPEINKDTSQEDIENSPEDSDKDRKSVAINKELQQLAFINPGRLTVTAGFNPEFSNREKRKLSRLMEQQNGKSEAGKGLCGLKPKRLALHNSSGCLEIDGRDLCDCQDPNCPGCHYSCPQCGSEKCGSSCRCSRRWSYDHVDVYNEGTLMR